MEESDLSERVWHPLNLFVSIDLTRFGGLVKVACESKQDKRELITLNMPDEDLLVFRERPDRVVCSLGVYEKKGISIGYSVDKLSNEGTKTAMIRIDYELKK